MSHTLLSKSRTTNPNYERWRIRIFAITWIAYAGFYFTRQTFSVAKLGILEDPVLHLHLTKSVMANLDAAYLAAVRRRFGRWILDTADATFDQAWLDYQHEIGLRHHRTKKNQTDGARAPAIVPFRDLFALVFPVTFTLRPFLAKKGASPTEVDAMHAAWVKTCLVQVTLWSHPYVKPGDF